MIGRFARTLRRWRGGSRAPADADLAGFDPVFYARRYPDLGQLETTEAIVAHFRVHGRSEGRFGSAAAEEEALYRQFLTPSADFDVQAYRALNPDLAQALTSDQDYILHFIRNGRREGRPAVFTGGSGDGPQPSWAPLLDVSQLLAWSSDWLSRRPVSRADAIRLFAEEGIDRLAPLNFALVFDPAFYRAHYHPGSPLDDRALYRLWLDQAVTGREAPNERHLLMPVLGDDSWPEAFDWQAYGRAARLPDDAGRARALLHLAEAKLPPADLFRFVSGDDHALVAALARYRANRGRFAEAEALLEALPDRDGWPWSTSLLLARVKEQLGKLEPARDTLVRAIGAGASQFAPVADVARLDLALGQWDRALDWLLQHHATWGDDPQFHALARTCVDRNFEHLTACGHAALAAHRAALDEADVGETPPHDFTRLMEAGLARIESAIARFEPAPAVFGPRLGGHIAVLGNTRMRQCTHYRIEQKLEQFAAIGLGAVLHPEEDADSFIADLPGARAAIFYRVAASPAVMRAILAARRMGIPTYYEIDDLLFDSEAFPPPLASFADHISPADHAGLQFGVPLFRHALAMCDKAIASTPALLEHMALLTRSGTGILVRNGLDSRNPMDLAPRAGGSDGRTGALRIFYGSNTLAHNADFAELAGPALLRIMDEFPAVELMVVGHTQLPDGFARHAGRIVRVPTITQIADYWALLAGVDINLAVLHRDAAADCKSEIKWLEAAVFAIPSIVSGTRTYRDVIDPGQDGLIADSPEEWYAALSELVRDPAERRRIGLAAREAALGRYACETIAAAWEQEFAEPSAPAAPAGPRARTRVLVCNVFYAPNSRGGATRVVEGNVARFGEAHPELELAVFTSDHLRGPTGQLRTSDVDGVAVYRVNVGPDAATEARPYNEAIDAAFRATLDLFRPDLVHFHCIQTLGASMLDCLREQGIPYVVTFHDGWWLSPQQFFLADGILRLPVGDVLDGLAEDRGRAITTAIRRNRLQPLLDAAARLLTVSAPFARLCHDAGLSRIEVVANGVPVLPEPRPASARSGPLRLGHVGGRMGSKGADLIEAALRLGDYRNLHLTMVDGALPPGTSRETRWGATPVTLVAPCPPDEIGALYESLDVLLAPSTWPESFGLVAREARHFGLWVVAGNLGAMGDDLREGVDGFVIDVSSRAGLDSVLARLDSDSAAYRRGTPPPAGQMRSANEQADELAALYRQVAGHAR